MLVGWELLLAILISILLLLLLHLVVLVERRCQSLDLSLHSPYFEAFLSAQVCMVHLLLNVLQDVLDSILLLAGLPRFEDALSDIEQARLIAFLSL